MHLITLIKWNFDHSKNAFKVNHTFKRLKSLTKKCFSSMGLNWLMVEIFRNLKRR